MHLWHKSQGLEWKAHLVWDLYARFLVREGTLVQTRSAWGNIGLLALSTPSLLSRYEPWTGRRRRKKENLSNKVASISSFLMQDEQWKVMLPYYNYVQIKFPDKVQFECQVRVREVHALRWAKTYPSTTIFQKNVNVFFVLEVVVKLHDVLVMKNSVKLYFLVNLKGKARSVLLASFTSAKPAAYTCRRHVPNREGPSLHTKKIFYSTVIHTFSLWWGLATLLWGIIFAA